MNKIVKLYVYNIEADKTTIGVEEAQDFEDFVLVSAKLSDKDDDDIATLHQQLTEAFGEKKILLFDESLDLMIYGVKESDELESLETTDAS